MNGPKFRFTLVFGLLLLAWWAFDMVTNYLLGPQGLNFQRYLLGVGSLGGAALAGFTLVWGTVTLIAAIKHRTGFEASVTDEYGTEFRMGQGKPFAITLTKFLPQVVASPSWQGLSPLEAELFGFYNGLKHWPYDISPSNGHPGLPLPDYALNLWQNMAAQTGAGPAHRAYALASCLGRVACLKEKRTSAPWYHVTVRDKVSFSKRWAGGLRALHHARLQGAEYWQHGKPHAGAHAAHRPEIPR
jgi:hypothetical protein